MNTEIDYLRMALEKAKKLETVGGHIPANLVVNWLTSAIEKIDELEERLDDARWDAIEMDEKRDL